MPLTSAEAGDVQAKLNAAVTHHSDKLIARSIAGSGVLDHRPLAAIHDTLSGKIRPIGTGLIQGSDDILAGPKALSVEDLFVKVGENGLVELLRKTRAGKTLQGSQRDHLLRVLEEACPGGFEFHAVGHLETANAVLGSVRKAVQRTKVVEPYNREPVEVVEIEEAKPSETPKAAEVKQLTDKEKPDSKIAAIFAKLDNLRVLVDTGEYKADLESNGKIEIKYSFNPSLQDTVIQITISYPSGTLSRQYVSYIDKNGQRDNGEFLQYSVTICKDANAEPDYQVVLDKVSKGGANTQQNIFIKKLKLEPEVYPQNTVRRLITMTEKIVEEEVN